MPKNFDLGHIISILISPKIVIFKNRVAFKETFLPQNSKRKNVGQKYI